MRNSDTTNPSGLPIIFDVDTGTITIPKAFVPTLTPQQSEDAHGTQIHSLRLMEQIVLSGLLDVQSTLKTLETLASYQFAKGSIAARKRVEKSVGDLMGEWLEETDDKGGA